MKVLILTDGGKHAGFGHIARCISLYQVLNEANLESEFIINCDTSILGLLDKIKYRVFNWHKADIFRLTRNADTVIVDSYLIDLAFCKKISRFVELPVYIDDLNRLSYPRGIVINGSIGADGIGYLHKKDVEYFLGAKYALLRNEYRHIPEKSIKNKAKTMLITFGGSNVASLIKNTLNYLDAICPHFDKKVLIGNSLIDKEKLGKSKYKNTFFIRNSQPKMIKKLMLDCDIAISAGGQTLYELARVGVPTIGIGVAGNQKRNLIGFEEAGFIEYIGWHKDPKLFCRLKESMAKLLHRDERAKRSKAGRSLIDGKGASRVISVINSKRNIINEGKCMSVILRKVQKNDRHDLLIWRNHPNTRKMSFDAKPIKSSDHMRWFNANITNRKVGMYIAENTNGQKIGHIRFEPLNKASYQVSVNMNPVFRGMGLGHRIIENGTKSFLQKYCRVREVVAKIMIDNIASKKAFQRAGYVFMNKSGYNGKTIEVFKFKKQK